MTFDPEPGCDRRFLPSRRRLLLAGAALLPLLAGCSALPPVTADDNDPTQDFADIEAGAQARLGVALLDTGNNHRILYRGDELFPMCSTFKLLLVAMVLNRVDRGEDSLQRLRPFGRQDLLMWAPVARKHVREGHISVAALCAAAIEQSDNTAANLLLADVGGPEALTDYIRSIGDTASRVDRVEPEINSGAPGDPRDTTTPAAMLADLQTLLLGDALSDASRAQLREWLSGNATGSHRLRAGLPADWRFGDKTGSGEHGSTNDIGILLPPQRAPILLAVYLTECASPMRARNDVLASIGRVVANAV